MPRMMVSFSDFTGRIVPQDQEATVIVRSHPMLDEAVQLDASLTEVSPLMEDAGEFVVLDITAGGETKQVVAELAQFNLLFTDDPYKALKDAKRVRPSNGTRSGGNTQAKRAWCRENGWPELKDKGKLPADAEAAYLAAHPAA